MKDQWHLLLVFFCSVFFHIFIASFLSHEPILILGFLTHPL